MKRISVIIPTLNEEKGIGNVLKKMPKSIYEVIVVDGKSKDNTVKIAKRHGAKIIIEKRKGYGRAYKTGFKYVRGDIIATLDGDGSYNPTYILEMSKVMEENNLDFISANRLNNLKKGSMPVFRRIGNVLISKASDFLFSTRIKDNQSGMWLFRKSMLKKMKLKEDGMPFSSEIKLEAYKKGKFVEYPIGFLDRKGKRTTNAIKQGYMIFRFLLRRRFG